MEITPPVSPREEDSEAVNNPLWNRAEHGFECSGESAKDSQFHPYGFLRSGEISLFNGQNSFTTWKNSCFNVFGQFYDAESICEEDLWRLFNIARNRMCQLDAAQKATVGTYGLLNGPSTSVNCGVDFPELRRELREFFMILRFLLAVESSGDEFLWVLEALTSPILQGLTLIRAQLGWLTDLPSYVLNNAHTLGSGTKVAFHLFHCHLELRWLHITTLWQFSAAVPSSGSVSATHVPEDTMCRLYNTNFKTLLFDAVQLCLTDLIQMAVVRFSTLSPEQMMTKSAFNCVCVKELWLLLRHLLEHLPESNEKVSFWSLIESFLQRIVPKEKSDHDNKKIARSHLLLPATIACSDPTLFSLWIMRHLGELFKYDSNGQQLEQSSLGHEGNHGALKRVLNAMTDPSVTLTEWQRRVSVMLVKVLITELWGAKPDPIMMLWECFYRSLDSAFQLPGATVGAYAVLRESAQGMLDSLVTLLDTKPDKNTNSYEHFLHLLGQYLSKNPSHWKLKMKGRVYSKLSARKADSLSEMGLYHLVQLLLTVAIKTDLEDVATTVLKLLRYNEGSAAQSRNTMVMRAHLSTVLLFARRGLPLAVLLQSITKSVSDQLACGQLAIPRMFVETLEDIMSSHESLELDQHLLVGEWINQYVSQRNPDAVRVVLYAMLAIIKKLHARDSVDYDGGGAGKLVAALRDYLLPYIKEQMVGNGSPPFQVADLAVQFTLLSLEYPVLKTIPGHRPDTFDNLLLLFLGDSSNINMVRRYLWLILSDEVALNSIFGQTPDIQLLIIQAWMRCSLLSTELDHQEMRRITQCVFSMPRMLSLTCLSREILKSLESTCDPFCALLERLGDQVLKCQNVSQYRKDILSFLQPLVRWVRTLKTQLFPPKSKDIEQKAEHINADYPKEVVIRVYEVLGRLVSDCGSIIFEKNTNSCLLVQLVPLFLLPSIVYNPDTRLPIAMDEALRHTLLLFLRGLQKLDPAKEKCIKRFIWDLVMVYVPRMAVHPGMLGCVGQTNPFVKIWDDPIYMSAATVTVQAICEQFLCIDKKSGLPNQNYIVGVRLIRDLAKRNKNDDMFISVMIEHVFPSSLEVVAKATDVSANIKVKETESMLQHIFQSEAYVTHPPLWEQTNRVLSNLSKKYLSFNRDLFSRMLNFLIRDFRPIVKRFLPELKVHIEDTVRKRGTGEDKRLQELLETAVNS